MTRTDVLKVKLAGAADGYLKEPGQVSETGSYNEPWSENKDSTYRNGEF